MSAVILQFDRRARTDDVLGEEQILSRCRTAAIGQGCNGAQRAAVEQAARKWIAQKSMKPHQMIEAARKLASQMVTFPNGPSAA
jgi:hypothetical protein